MADEGQEFSGKTVEEATEEGLAQLGLRADQAEIEVLSRGSRGIFGIGSEPARVRISRRAEAAKPAARPAPAAIPQEDAAAPPSSVTETAVAETPSAPTDPEPAEDEAARGDTAAAAPQTASATAEADTPVADGSAAPGEESDEEAVSALAQKLLAQLVQHMGFECTIEAAWREPADDESDRYLHLDIHGSDLGALIGRRGETLAGIQYLVRLMVNQQIRQWKPIVVDVENYKERRQNQLAQLALRMADQVIESGRAMSLEPMPPNERRIIHLTLRDHPQVYTQSSGEGDRRKVHIVVKEG